MDLLSFIISEIIITIDKIKAKKEDDIRFSNECSIFKLLTILNIDQAPKNMKKYLIHNTKYLINFISSSL